MSIAKTLSIGFVSPGWPVEAFASGIVTYVSNLVPQLREMGHQVSVMAHNVAPGERDSFVYCADHDLLPRPLGRRALDSLWYRLAPGAALRSLSRRSIEQTSRRMAAERGVQIIEMEESFGAARIVQKATRVPVCIRLHGPWFLTGPASGVLQDRAYQRRVMAEGAAISAAHAVCAPAQDVLQRVRDYYHLELKNAEVIPNPVGTVPANERWRLETCDRRLVLFVGRFDHLKGGDLIVEAFDRVLENFPDARLCLVGPDGEFPDSDGCVWTLKQFVSSRVPGALESGRVEWLGPQPFTALAALRRRALVCVVCSRYENYPYAVTEAMALGCPVVAARAGGIPEIIRDGTNGLLHEPGDAADLARKIVSLMLAPKDAAELGHQGATYAERVLSPDIIASRLVAFYRRTIDGAERMSGAKYR